MGIHLFIIICWKGFSFFIELSGFLCEKSALSLWICFWALSPFCLIDLTCLSLLNHSVGISVSSWSSFPSFSGRTILSYPWELRGTTIWIPHCGTHFPKMQNIANGWLWQEFCRWTEFCSWMTSVCSYMKNLVSYSPFHCNLGQRVMLKKNMYGGMSEHRLQNSLQTSKSKRTIG